MKQFDAIIQTTLVMLVAGAVWYTVTVIGQAMDAIRVF